MRLRSRRKAAGCGSWLRGPLLRSLAGGGLLPDAWGLAAAGGVAGAEEAWGMQALGLVTHGPADSCSKRDGSKCWGRAARPVWNPVDSVSAWLGRRPAALTLLNAFSTANVLAGAASTCA